MAGANRREAGPRPRPAGPRLPSRRLLRRLGLAAAGLFVVGLVAVGLLLALTPSVGDAPQRSARLAAAANAGRPLAALPARLAAAVVAVEDHRFYQHPGIDILAAGRVVAAALRGRDAGGATIDAQLAKLLYTGGRQTWQAQVEQVGLSLKLDHRYAKGHLLLMYLNCVYFGHGFTGAAAAAQGYFGRSPDQLDWPQAALLAGVLRDPAGYDPRRHPQLAIARRNYALARLGAVGALSPGQVATFQRSGLELGGQPPAP